MSLTNPTRENAWDAILLSLKCFILTSHIYVQKGGIVLPNTVHCQHWFLVSRNPTATEVVYEINFLEKHIVKTIMCTCAHVCSAHRNKVLHYVEMVTIKCIFTTQSSSCFNSEYGISSYYIETHFPISCISLKCQC